MRWWLSLHSPQRVARQFLAAVERKGVDALYALLRLNGEVKGRMLRYCAASGVTV